MNLVSNCRYPLWFPLLCRKWVWLSWPLSSLEWKLTASITAMLLSQQMLPAIKHVASDTFVFQQDNAASHRAKDTIKQLQQERRNSLVLTSGHQTAQTWSWSLGCYAAESVWMSYEQCRRAEAMPHWRLEQSAAERYWRGHQRVEKATESMRACRLKHFEHLLRARVTNKSYGQIKYK